MAAPEFVIPSHWLIEGRVDDVYDLISKPQDFVRWWSEVYLRVEEIVPGDEKGIGTILDLHTRGWLPYTLRWRSKATDVEKPNRLVIAAQGDLEGRGEWRFRQDGEWVRADFDWIVVFNKPWLRHLVPVLKPLFAANHRWAMRKGQAGLERELARRKSAELWGKITTP